MTISFFCRLKIKFLILIPFHFFIGLFILAYNLDGPTRVDSYAMLFVILIMNLVFFNIIIFLLTRKKKINNN